MCACASRSCTHATGSCKHLKGGDCEGKGEEMNGERGIVSACFSRRDTHLLLPPPN